jgi:hypothetical protein
VKSVPKTASRRRFAVDELIVQPRVVVDDQVAGMAQVEGVDVLDERLGEHSVAGLPVRVSEAAPGHPEPRFLDVAAAVSGQQL